MQFVCPPQEIAVVAASLGVDAGELARDYRATFQQYSDRCVADDWPGADFVLRTIEQTFMAMEGHHAAIPALSRMLLVERNRVDSHLAQAGG